MRVCKTKQNLGYKKKDENTERHGKHNSRQGNEKERGGGEEEGKERSSHRLSIGVYHSGMQCGVWPHP